MAAEIDRIFARYIEIVFRHMWEEAKTDDPEVIRAALDGSGLDGARALERMQDPAVKERLLRNTEQSVTRGTLVRLLSLSARRFSLARIACARSRRR